MKIEQMGIADMVALHGYLDKEAELYITKPKYVSQSDYDLMLKKIKIAFEP